MAEPIHQFNASGARDAVAEGMQSIDAMISDLDSQVMKLHALTKAAIRSGALDASGAKRVCAVLITARNDARGWRARLAEIRRATQTEAS
jgi:hypothetical protein